jgi:branched-chain amino acid transport system substrate-binding protein
MIDGSAGLRRCSDVPRPADAGTGTGADPGTGGARRVRRRDVLRWAGSVAGAAAAAGPASAVLGACGASADGTTATGTRRAVRIGYVSSQTGALAGFGEADAFVVDQMRTVFDKGLMVGGTRYPVEIAVRDSQSDRNQAAQAASDLILNGQVDVMLVASSAETTNPVADQCEANQVPCISAVAPWQTWLRGRGGSTDRPFRWTYHFSWGLDDLVAVYTDMWRQVGSNKHVGALWPDTPEGKVFADPAAGLPPALRRAGYDLSAPVAVPAFSGRFAAQLNRFRADGVQLVTGMLTPQEFATFWQQAGDADYRPRLVTVSQALLFPSSVQALGDAAGGLGTEVWWSPNHQYKSSLTGQTCRQLAEDYTARTGRQWTQPLGFAHALFEIANEALALVSSPSDRTGLAAALRSLRTDTVCGPVRFGASASAPRTVATAKLAGGQWRRTGGMLDLVVVSSRYPAEIPVRDRARAAL